MEHGTNGTQCFLREREARGAPNVIILDFMRSAKGLTKRCQKGSTGHGGKGAARSEGDC